MKKVTILLLVLLGIVVWYFIPKSNLAEEKVKQLPEVKNLLNSGNWIVRNEERNNGYTYVQVAEVVDGHTNTFNWYKIDKQGNIVCSMFAYDEQGNLQKDIEGRDCN